ncbi:MAG: DUF4825 domain-containing protein [Lachnospiraceae bacterium]|nr:DUF4825 domain-containing protein [Lachnospiraceae bacterium]
MREAIITSSILIVCIALLRRICKGKISAGVQYMLWLIVAVRLIMPGITAVFPHVLPESNFSIMNMADKMETSLQNFIQPMEMEDTQVMFVQDGFTFDELPVLGGVSADGPTAVFVAGHVTWTWTWIDWLKRIWYFGMAVAGIWMIAVNIRFFIKLKKDRIRYEKEDFKLPVYTAKTLSSPCLYGLPGRQSIYLPEDVTGDDEKVKHILTHEYCHYKHADVFWSALRCILLTVYWFHPLVWLAAVLSKQDCELACDEAVIKMLGEEERISYGKTLVSLVTRKTTASDMMCAATTMTGGAENIKERVKRIAEKPHRLAVVLILCVAAVGVAAAFTFTQAKRYPEGTYLLEGESALTVTTSSFQVTFPDSFVKRAYCRGENGTDIIVYHKDSDREIGRFCMMDYEEARQLADEREVVPFGEYGSSPTLRTYISYGQEPMMETTDHFFYPEGNNNDSGGVPGMDSNADGGIPGTDSNADAGVSGTDSNSDETTYLLPDESIEGTMVQESGGFSPIPAPEKVEKEIINLPYDSEENYGAVDVGEEDAYLPNEKITITENGETESVTEHYYYIIDDSGAESVGTTTPKEESRDYLPNEVITTTGRYMPVDAPCYVYIPADNRDAKANIQAELTEMNEELIELADSVVILYQGREAMRYVLETLVQNRTPYVGDAVKVSKIASGLPVATGLSYQYVELETATEPYGMTLYYRLEVDNMAQISPQTQFLEFVLLFASIENLEECTIRVNEIEDMPAGQDIARITYKRSDMEKLFGPLYPCSETQEGMIALYNRVLDFFDDEN